MGVGWGGVGIGVGRGWARDRPGMGGGEGSPTMAGRSRRDDQPSLRGEAAVRACSGEGSLFSLSLAYKHVRAEGGRAGCLRVSRSQINLT